MTAAEARAQLETTIRQAHERGDLEGAATAALSGYGPEILGFLVGVLRDDEVASEAFSQFAEDLWKGLAGFAWRCSFRTWAYTLARHASARLLREPTRRRERRLETGEVSKLAEEVRENTLTYLKTEVKRGVDALRAQLTPEERELLILRVDRQLGWADIAEVLAADEEPKKAAAALRKRFERVKVRLRDLAVAEGLIEAAGTRGGSPRATSVPGSERNPKEGS
ncbi:MAG: hypothetical protein AUK47_22615 [Deltaproteobacteria bacterium CG2_30_63_29]|nr:MAG: hypothetical protein AUK47_22615 [Deltaproteobacteria bacterium CG2_30_63_29]PJB45520.1 MAG: RNA polymerase subunit sigma-24 [Deltaproteobacteria bacterium CG_4_9_14_3_um_filter_63_12]